MGSRVEYMGARGRRGGEGEGGGGVTALSRTVGVAGGAGDFEEGGFGRGFTGAGLMRDPPQLQRKDTCRGRSPPSFTSGL